MSTITDRLEFAIVLHEECSTPERPVTEFRTATLARKLMAAARRRHRLNEAECNGFNSQGALDACEAASERLQNRVARELKPYGIGAVWQGDPRGAPLQLVLPRTKRKNGWGGEGYVVPR